MWFDSWSDLAGVALVGTATYVVLIVVLRVSGKRTLSQLNAFDFVVTVALGSMVATIILSAEVSLAEGVTALVLLAALQFAVAGISSRWKRLRRVVTAGPTLLLLHGRMDSDALRRHRLSESEVLQAIRTSGRGDVNAIAAVVLESSGALSVVSEDHMGDASALGDVDLPR